MSTTIFKEYIQEIKQILIKHGIREIAEKADTIRIEREKIIGKIWDNALLERDFEVKNVVRQIDFDIIITLLLKHTKPPKIIDILEEIAILSLRFSEYEKAVLILKKLITEFRTDIKEERLPDHYYRYAQALSHTEALSLSRKALFKCLTLYAKFNNPVGIARAKNGLAIVSVEEGKLKEGESLLLEVMRILENLQNSTTEVIVLKANVLMNHGNLLIIRAEWDRALEQYEKAHALLKNGATDQLTTGLLFYNMAIAYKTLEQPEKAEELLQKALEVAEEIKNRNLKALALSLKAEILAYGGKFSEAHATAITAFTIFNQINNKANIADVYRILGMIKREEGDYDMSLSFLNTSSRINEECKKFFNLAETYIELAKLYKRMGEQKQFDHYVGLAKRQYKKIGAIKRIEALRNI